MNAIFLPKSIFKRFKQLAFILFVWFCGHILFTVYIGSRNEVNHSTFGIVLGNKVNTDGSLSPRLKSRLDKTLRLFRDGQIINILVTGGLGKEGHWEGTVMKDYLVQNGIPDSLILVDDYGNNTWNSAMNARKMIQDEKVSITIISNYYHLLRCKKLFGKAGFNTDCIGLASPDYMEARDLYSLTREFIAYYVE